MENVEGVKKKGKRKESRFGKRYGFEVKLRWVKAYQERGESGLRNRIVSSGSRRKLPGPVREKIIEIKKRESFFGVKQISHLLKRAFFLNASP